MKRKPQVVTSTKDLRACFQSLTDGDIVLGRLLLKPSENHMLIDLVGRGVRLFPSALSQMLSRSKTFQTLVFEEYMFPHTLAVHDLHDLIRAMPFYHEHGVTRVVTKMERDNGGRGIHLWPSLEDVYSRASLGMVPFPFVIQPFIPDCRDIRVIILGDYLEAYWRHNPYNFRNNLHFGAKSSPCKITAEQKSFCAAVMERGKFPYAHIDLMVTETDEFYLTEINLIGGIKGAKISQARYKERVAAIHEKYLHARQ